MVWRQASKACERWGDETETATLASGLPTFERIGPRKDLRILAALSLLLHDEDLRRLLQDRAPAAKLFERILALERGRRVAGAPGGTAPEGGAK